MIPGQLLLNAGTAELAQLSARSLVIEEIDDCLGVLMYSLGLAYTAASPAETLVSRRSKATTGISNAMYSIVLFIVDTSLSGFFGSGDSPTSAVDMIRLTSSSGARPVNSTARRAELVPQRHQFVEAVAGTDQREGDVIPAELVHDDVGGPHHDVHAVLRAHDADYAARYSRPRRELGSAAPRLSRSGSGPVRTTVTSAGRLAAPRDGDLPVGVVGGDHVIGGPVGSALQPAQPPVGQLRPTGETGQEELWAQVVVVEHELGPLDSRKARAMGQKMSGGLHAWRTANRPLRRALA